MDKESKYHQENIETGIKIKALREERGMTQAELAKSIGYSTNTPIYFFERGDRSIPIVKLHKIAQVLGTNVDYLTGHTKRKNRTKADELADENFFAARRETFRYIMSEEDTDILLDVYRSMTKTRQKQFIETVKLIDGNEKLQDALFNFLLSLKED